MSAAAPSLDALRARIRAMERLKPPPPDDVEVHPSVPRRIAPACLHQIVGGPGPATALAAGIAGRLAVRLERPVLWVTAGDDLYPPGLAAFGLSPGAVIVAAARDGTEALWSMEEGLKSAALACVVGEAAAVDMTAGRRLQLAAEAGGTTGLLLHPPGARAANAGTTRWRVSGLPGNRWRLVLERGRDGMPGEWEVEV